MVRYFLEMLSFCLHHHHRLKRATDSQHRTSPGPKSTTKPNQQRSIQAVQTEQAANHRSLARTRFPYAAAVARMRLDGKPNVPSAAVTEAIGKYDRTIGGCPSSTIR